MPSIPFPKQWCLRTAPSFGVLTSDVKLHCWTRRRAARGQAVFGGQTLFALADDARWVNSRALRPHLGKLVEGIKSPPAPTDPPIVSAFATGLCVEEETGAAMPDERAIVPTATALRIRWESSQPLDFSAGTAGVGESGATSGGGWQWRALDAVSGEAVASGITREPIALSPNATTPNAATFEVQVSAAQLGNGGRCLLFFVNASGVEKPYRWPLDYRTVTGETEFKPARLMWTHPALGPLHFDPKRRVGAMPYDRSDPVQAALLNETASLEASGKLELRGEWADFLITFNADGSPVAAGGEFSCLKIQSAAQWCGDHNVSLAATAGACLWLGDEAGALTPLVVEPRLRRVMALWEESDGTFWIAGDAATRNGLKTAFLKVDENWIATLAAYGDPFESRGEGIEITSVESRALLSARAGHSISRDRGGALHVLTFAGKMRLTQKRDKAQLVRVGEGGRSGATLERLDGTRIGAHVLDPDRAKSEAFGIFGAPKGGGHALFEGSPYPGPALAKQFESALCAKETFWSVVASSGEKDGPEDDQQGLARFTLGGIEVLKWWKTSHWDMGRVVPWARGVYTFGFGEKGTPRAHRWTGDGDGLLEMGLSLPYLVTWGQCGLVPDGQSETLRIIGKKFFGRRELPGWYAAEGSSGAGGAGGVTAGSGAVTTDFGWDGGQGAFTISLADLAASGFEGSAFPPFIQWNALGAAWIACKDAPQDAQGNALVPYLVFDGSGDPLRFTPGPGVVLPQSVNKWCGLRFSAGTCQGVVSRRLFPEPNCGPMDVAVIIDITGSMGGAISDVKNEIAAVCADLGVASGGDYRLALLTTNNTVRVNVEFSPNNLEEFTSAIGGLYSIGGLTPWGEAINTVVNTLSATDRLQTGDFTTPFRADARKILIVISDDWPDGLGSGFASGVDDLKTQDYIEQAVALGVQISAVFVTDGQGTGPAQVITEIMESAAAQTNGLFVSTEPSGKGSGRGLSDVINSCGGNIQESFTEYCTDDLVVPVSCCGSAACVYGEGDEGRRVGMFRLTSPGPINAIWFLEQSNPEAFAAMCAGEQRLWGRIDGTSTLAPNPDGGVSPTDKAVLSEFNIAVPLGREFWLPRQARTFDLIAIVDEGVSIEADFGAVH